MSTSSISPLFTGTFVYPNRYQKDLKAYQEDYYNRVSVIAAEYDRKLAEYPLLSNESIKTNINKLKLLL